MKRTLALALLFVAVFSTSTLQAQELGEDTAFVLQLTEMEVKATVLDYLASPGTPAVVPKEKIEYLTKLVAMEKADLARLQRKALCLRIAQKHPACQLPENAFYKGKLVQDPESKKLFHEGYEKKPLEFFLSMIIRERLILINVQSSLEAPTEKKLLKPKRDAL